MKEKSSKFNPVLRYGDVLVVACGAMIGWGWVVSSGQWIQSGGILGTIIGFLIGGIMIYFEQICWLLFKSFMIIFAVIWVRATLPRMASFDLLKFSWSVLLPVSIINFFLMVLIKYLGGLYA